MHAWVSPQSCVSWIFHARRTGRKEFEFRYCTPMVKLFLFRLGSLIALLILLVWEAFYRQDAADFTGRKFIHVKIKHFWILLLTSVQNERRFLLGTYLVPKISCRK